MSRIPQEYWEKRESAETSSSQRQPQSIDWTKYTKKKKKDPLKDPQRLLICDVKSSRAIDSRTCETSYRLKFRFLCIRGHVVQVQPTRGRWCLIDVSDGTGELRAWVDMDAIARERRKYDRFMKLCDQMMNDCYIKETKEEERKRTEERKKKAAEQAAEWRRKWQEKQLKMERERIEDERKTAMSVDWDEDVFVEEEKEAPKSRDEDGAAGVERTISSGDNEWELVGRMRDVTEAVNAIDWDEEFVFDETVVALEKQLKKDAAEREIERATASTSAAVPIAPTPSVLPRAVTERTASGSGTGPIAKVDKDGSKRAGKEEKKRPEGAAGIDVMRVAFKRRCGGMPPNLQRLHFGDACTMYGRYGFSYGKYYYFVDRLTIDNENVALENLHYLESLLASRKLRQH